ncbi:MAG TPA: NAD(P)-binding protein [Spirochaetota bacterium]|nr:NAD(P)-binding protein [Spirochaetota bacterium]
MKNNNDFDVIIIGSGLGSLTTASLLTKINKKRVLVLEKHYEIGGLTHEFKRGPYSWDVGLHYVGNLSARAFDSVGMRLFSFITDNNLKWNNMPEIFEKLVFPDMRIDIRESKKGYMESLLEKFPHEKKAIKKYIKDVYKIRKWYLLYFFSRFLRFPLNYIFQFFSLFYKKKALMTTKEYLDKNIKNEKLKAVLAARWGNYGLTPSDSSFAIHSLVEHHYYSGGMFPDGGSEKIATFIENSLEKYGSRIVTSHEVTEIIVKNGKAIGVKVKDLSQKEPEIKEFYAPIIISGAGSQITYLNLLKNYDFKIQNQLKNFKKSYSGLNLYLGLKDSPEKLGIKGENYWIIQGYELDIFDRKHLDVVNGNPVYCFLSFPSIKSGKKGGHTADVVTMMPYDFFENWKDGKWKNYEKEYYELKEKISENLLNIIEKHIPGFKDLVVYKELASPLTFEFFTGRMGGSFYGLPATPERFKIKDLKVKTPIKNLYLTGTDILSNGILPALMSGMATVSYLNGFFGIIKVMSKVFSYDPLKKLEIKTDNHIFIDKKYGTLVKKTFISENIVELIYKFNEKLNFIPGQHIKLKVGIAEWRAYSVAKIDNDQLSLVIDIRPGGHGANYIRNIEVGTTSLFRLPLTDMTFKNTDNNIMFIATGTGLIPFLHIIDEMKKNNLKNKIIILFGCLTEKDNWVENYIKPYLDEMNIELYIYIEKPISEESINNKNIIKGRVTDFINEKFIKEHHYNVKDFDFYVCGHPNMTTSTVKLLRSLGSNNVYY